MQNPIMQMLGNSGGTNSLLSGLMQTAKQTLKNQSPQMILSFIASQPGYNEWFEANKHKTIAELVGQIS